MTAAEAADTIRLSLGLLGSLHASGERGTASTDKASVDGRAALAVLVAAAERADDSLSALVYIEQRYGRLDGVGWDRVLPALAADGEDKLSDDLATLRAAWNAHFATCPTATPDFTPPTWEQIQSWIDAPSNTASGGSALAADDEGGAR